MDVFAIITSYLSSNIGAYITIYSSCIPKGRVHMPFSFREMIERVKYSKVKLYKGVDVDLKVILSYINVPNNKFFTISYFILKNFHNVLH